MSPSILKPVLTVVGVTLGLVVVLGITGTLSYLAGLEGYTPLALAYLPIAILLAIAITARRAWVPLRFVTPRATSPSALWFIPLAAVLPLVVIVTSSGISGEWTAVLGFAGLAVLVAFVEETLFRGVLRRAFARTGRTAEIVVPSVAFAVAHAVTAISPDQDAWATVRTVVFAFFFGVIATLLIELTGSILPSIALHAVFDFVGFVFVARSAAGTDIAVIAVAALLTAAMLIARRVRVVVPAL